MTKGWESKKLGELAEIELGRTPARASSALWDEKHESGNVWLSIADLLNAEDHVVNDSKEYVSDRGASLCKLVPKGTLLVSFKLTLGRLAFAGRDLFTNEAIAALTLFNERELSRDFLFWFLQFFDWVKAAENDVKLKGMTLNKAKLKELVVHFPKSLAEQQRIVGVLDEAFAVLATAQAHAEKNLQNARALFESHLQSVFTEHGSGWVKKRLEDVCIEIFAGGDVPKNNHSKTPTQKHRIPIYTNGEKNNGLYGYAEAARVTLPSITISARGTIGYAAIRNESYFPAIRLVVVIPDKTMLDLVFLYYAIKSMVIGHSGTSIPQLTVPMVRDFSISIPSLTEQRKIASQLNALATESQRLEGLYDQKLTALAALKKSLLHQAFSGAL